MLVQGIQAQWRWASEDYLSTLRVPLLRGSYFNAAYSKGNGIVLSEGLVCESGYRHNFRNLRERPPQRQQRPPTVDAAVPVEAAVEDRVERRRQLHVLGPDHDMVELVRPFAAEMAERQRREARGEFWGKKRHLKPSQ